MNPATSYTSPDLFIAPRHAAWPFGSLAPASYGLIMADPPWHFELYSAKGEGKSAQAQYRIMPLDEIAALPVADLADGDCLLWLWVTNPMLPQGLDVMRSWGFRYVTHGAWSKRTVNGCQAMGTGYVLRSAHETFLVGALGQPQCTRGVRSLIEGPVREHSRKPDQAYTAAERLLPTVRRAELFSRELRPGWECWGDESGKFDGDDRTAAPGRRRRLQQPGAREGAQP